MAPNHRMHADARGWRGTLAVESFDQIVAYAKGTPINVVNPEVLKRR